MSNQNNQTALVFSYSKSAAAVRRGVLDANEAQRYEKPGHNLHEGFELSGLGQLTEAAIVSDRMITFGA